MQSLFLCGFPCSEFTYGREPAMHGASNSGQDYQLHISMLFLELIVFTIVLVHQMAQMFWSGFHKSRIV